MYYDYQLNKASERLAPFIPDIHRLGFEGLYNQDGTYNKNGEIRLGYGFDEEEFVTKLQLKTKNKY